MLQYPPLLRPQFFGHVIGPIAHHVIGESAQVAEQHLHESLQRPDLFDKWFINFKRTEFADPKNALAQLVDSTRRATIDSSARVQNVTTFPLTREQIDLTKTLQDSKRKLWYKNSNGDFILKRESVFTIEGNGVLRALRFVAGRTQGLQVETLDDLVAFANRPEMPSVLRPLMAGGGQFDSLLETPPDKPVSPAFKQFCEQQMPVAILGEDGFVRTNEVVIEIAREFNKINNALAPLRQSSDGKIFGNSAGCPIKNLRFRQHTRLLDEFGASLTDEQIEILTSGKNPTAQAVQQVANGKEGQAQSFVIVKDGLSTTLELVARQLSEIPKAFERELALGTELGYLQHNYWLLGSPRVAGREPIQR